MRANQHLIDIAKTIGQKLPEDLSRSIDQSQQAFDKLWDDKDSTYYSRNFVTHEQIKISTISSLLPLYSGTISQERADQIVKQLKNKHLYKAKFPVPSVAVNSPWYNEFGYWQGPTWINTNWLLIDGLRRYGYEDMADELSKTCLDLVSLSGFYEYFSAHTGQPAGIANFSWTAALIVDLLNG